MSLRFIPTLLEPASPTPPFSACPACHIRQAIKKWHARIPGLTSLFASLWAVRFQFIPGRPCSPHRNCFIKHWGTKRAMSPGHRIERSCKWSNDLVLRHFLFSIGFRCSKSPMRMQHLEFSSQYHQ